VTTSTEPEVGTFPGLTAIQAIVEVMRRVQFVAKDQKMDPRAGMGNYAFRGIDDVVNAVGPALREVGMVIIPDEVLDLSYETVEVGQGDKRKPMASVRVRVRYRWYGPGGDFVDTESPGESFDSGDKGTTKAMSVAFRTNMIQTLCLPTGQPDPDSTAYERSAREPDGRTHGRDADTAPDEWAPRVTAAIDSGDEHRIRALWKPIHAAQGPDSPNLARLAAALHNIKDTQADAAPPNEPAAAPPQSVEETPAVADEGDNAEQRWLNDHPAFDPDDPKTKIALARWWADAEKAQKRGDPKSRLWEDIYKRAAEFPPSYRSRAAALHQEQENAAAGPPADDQPPF